MQTCYFYIGNKLFVLEEIFCLLTEQPAKADTLVLAHYLDGA